LTPIYKPLRLEFRGKVFL